MVRELTYDKTINFTVESAFLNQPRIYTLIKIGYDTV